MKGKQIRGIVICFQLLLAKHIITSMKDSIFKEVSSHIGLLQRIPSALSKKPPGTQSTG